MNLGPRPLAGPAERTPYGRYFLLRKLGQGGMAELFLAAYADPAEGDHPVVVKRMLPAYSSDPAFCQMFLNEARLAAQLRHPNIVQMFDLGLEQGQLYVALEYIDGADLETLVVGRKRLSAAMTVHLGAALCDALGYAHSAHDLQGRPLGLVHRDVTPDNVMIGRRGEIKLIDFGIAKALSTSQATTPGVVKGKLCFIAPESLRGEVVDGRADLFSLGALLYEMLTGRHPFERTSVDQTLTAVLTEEPPPPHQLVPGCPPELSQVILRCLEKDRLKRYGSAVEVRRDLSAVAPLLPPVGAADVATLSLETLPLPVPPPLHDLAAAGPIRLEPLAIADDTTDPTVHAKLEETRIQTVPGARLPASRSTSRRTDWPFLVVGCVSIVAATAVGWLSHARFSAEPEAAAGPDAGPALPIAALVGEPDAAEEPADAAAVDAGREEPEDAGEPADSAARARDAASTWGPDTLLVIKGKGRVSVDGRQCNAPCTVRVKVGPHVIERTGKHKFEKILDVPPGPPIVVQLPP